MHITVPSLHSPTFDTPHVPPTSIGLLSTTPLQSSSLPLHSSGCPPTVPIAPKHWIVPPTQWFAPATHSPVSVPHFFGNGMPVLSISGSPSSVSPLQSLSLPSQISGTGT